MTIEIYLNGKRIGERQVPAYNLPNWTGDSWQQNCERRERIIQKELESIKEELRPLLKSYLFKETIHLSFALCFESKMNKAGFVAQEDPVQLKKAS
jgi:hypothetical protein